MLKINEKQMLLRLEETEEKKTWQKRFHDTEISEGRGGHVLPSQFPDCKSYGFHSVHTAFGHLFPDKTTSSDLSVSPAFHELYQAYVLRYTQYQGRNDYLFKAFESG